MARFMPASGKSSVFNRELRPTFSFHLLGNRIPLDRIAKIELVSPFSHQFMSIKVGPFYVGLFPIVFCLWL